MSFTTKDSGERASFDSGMVRDTETGKTLWHKVFDGPLLRRWAELLTRGAEKYPDDEDTGQANWMKAEGEAEYLRFRRSAFRHFMQWYNGDLDEDHAAVMFNLNGAEYVKEKVETEKRDQKLRERFVQQMVHNANPLARHAEPVPDDVEHRIDAGVQPPTEDAMLAIMRKYDGDFQKLDSDVDDRKPFAYNR